MIEKISQLAERAATSASRREFLGRAAVWAGGLAVAFAGLLTPKSATAGAGKKGCHYYCSDGSAEFKEVSCSKECPPSFGTRRRSCALYTVESSGC